MDEQRTANPKSKVDIDLTTVLAGQHAKIRGLFATVLAAPPEGRAQEFGRLERLLAIHEAAEQESLHGTAVPAAPSDLGTAATGDASDEEVSARRLREEEAAGDTLEHLQGMDPTSLFFRLQVEDLEEAVKRHADAEETEELPRFLARASAEQRDHALLTMGRVEELAADTSEQAVVPVGGGFADQLAAARRALEGAARSPLPDAAEQQGAEPVVDHLASRWRKLTARLHRRKSPN